MKNFIHKKSLIITLDVDNTLFDKLKQIQASNFSVVELNHIEPDILVDALHAFPHLRLGVGNVLNTEQLEKAHQAGAHFASSLGFIPALVQTAMIYDFHYLPGVGTFSEAMQAVAIGCQHVKPFPATHTFCKNLNNYLPTLRLFPAEVTTQEEAALLLELPAVAAASILNPNLDKLRAFETSEV